MLPKTIILQYPAGFRAQGDREVQLPNQIHTRPSASETILVRTVAGEVTGALLRSSYDALYDIYLDLTIVGHVGQVKDAWFEETK